MEDNDYSIPPSPHLKRQKKSPFGDEMMELMCQNGQIVVQTKNLRDSLQASVPSDQSAGREVRSEEEKRNQLFIQEDEMASWLHYPLEQHSSFDPDFYSDLYTPCAPLTATTPSHATASISTAAAAPRPPIPPTRYLNFEHFSRIKPGPSISTKAARESTVVEAHEDVATVSGGNTGSGTMSRNAAAGMLLANCEVAVTSSSPVGSGASASASVEPSLEPAPERTEDRKRKGRDDDNAGDHGEDVNFESADAKKQSCGTTSTRRSRVAEVHNLSERRRRDRINEKMKALQELIPHSNKSDKASMLDEAIEYLKSLQIQLQMMSMGCGMVPVMFPGFQQYMPPMGMGMGMGMNLPVMVPLQNPAAAAHLSPRFPVPAFHIPPVHGSMLSRIQPTTQLDPAPNSLASQNPNQAQTPSFANPYQQYLGHNQGRAPLPKNKAMENPSTSKPSGTREAGNPDNHQPG